MKCVKSILLGTAVLTLSGCVSLLPDPAPADAIYRLNIARTNVPQSPLARIIRVDRPNVPTNFETQDIIVSPDGRRLAAAAGAKWSEVIPVMIQSSFIDVLGQRENLVGVVPSSGARTDTRLHITLKNFEAQFDQGEGNAPLAVVHYAVSLANASNRNLLGSFDVRKTARASEARVSTIVEAMDQANRDALNAVADWLETSPKKS